MPDYVQDPNDSNKQVPGALSDNYYGRAVVPATGSLVKSPNEVFIGNLDGNVGFYFGTSASFAALDFLVTGGITASNGSTQVTGSNSLFESEFKVGDKIKITSASNDGNNFSQILTIASIESDSGSNVDTNYTGGTISSSNILEVKGTLTSRHYKNYGSPSAGTEFNIHPIAFSGSSGDVVTFIYKGGLDGSPKPF